VLNKFFKIVGSQIEIEKILSLAEILISFRKFHLQSENLDKLIFVNKNWPNDLSIRCKFPSSLVDIIETNANLKEEFEKTCENNEIKILD